MKLSDIVKRDPASFLVGDDRELLSLSLDTRTLKPGDCFIALSGENFDGHDFIDEAIQKGAKSLILSQKEKIDNLAISACIVQDTMVTLGHLGQAKRKKSSASLIGLTGSCGKTTVKSMLGSILTPLAPTVVTAGNYNNHVGLPLTLWRLAPDTRYGVLEMGANHPGEIAYLSKLAEVDVALITNVAPAHLAGFGTLENVARAKGEIYDNLKPEGIAVLNADEPYLSLWQAKLSKQARVFFGLEVKKDIWADNIECYPLSSQFVLQTPVARQQVTLQVAGKHNISNALAAASAAYALGISLEDIVAGLEAFEGVLGRLCVYQGLNGVRLIDDTYNANPRSVEAALGVLANMPGDKIFVFGQMRELGQDEVSWHQKIGEIAKSKGIDKLYALGGLCQHTAEAFGEAARWFETHEDLILALKTECHPKVSLLIKGSRSSRMEKVVNALK